MMFMLWGRKIGMTQKFAPDTHKVIPVTVIDLCKWKILQRKTTEHDGYDAIQVGCLRNKYIKKEFNLDWIKSKKKYFLFIKEIRCEINDIFEIGSDLKVENVFTSGDHISVTGKTIGKGFQGVVKRYGFTGGRASHGSKLGRKPGSLGGLRKQGIVFKGKKMPGHCGNEIQTVSRIKVIDFSTQDNIVIIKGSIPGKSGSLVCLSKGPRL
jgi:large subunit ribosomal protein L3